jgi:signal transduction histidine kinase/ActR/RegA family two-component response regulator
LIRIIAMKKSQEEIRNSYLKEYRLLEPRPDQGLDSLTRLAARVCSVPFVALSLIDSNRVLFKSTVGLTLNEIPRCGSMCDFAAAHGSFFSVCHPDKDQRFSSNPIFAHHPGIRFYAAAPIVNDQGITLGTLSIMDSVPRDLTESQKSTLMMIARKAMIHLELSKLLVEQEMTSSHEHIREEDPQSIKERLNRAEEELRHSQRMEAVGRLAGGVAHDFNNLLMAIMGHSEMLLKQLDDGPMAFHAREILKAGERAASITQHLLSFSRKQRLNEKVIDTNGIVDNMKNMLQRLIGEHIELITITNHTGQIKGDQGQMEQILLNLVVNARDAMQDGGRLLIETSDVETTSAVPGGIFQAPPGSYVMLSVSDTGSGISYDILPHIFEPFFTTKGQGRGTGLGLSTVYGIVKQWGGEISVYSKPGRGTTFKIYLPRIEEERPFVTTEIVNQETIDGSETILLVDDEEVVRRIIHEILLVRGYKVLEAADVGQALQISKRHTGPIHLMIADLVMPHMNGRDLALKLQAYHPEMKVLYISGYTNDIIVRYGLNQGDPSFLQKPFTADALSLKVRELIESDRAEVGVSTS